MAYLRLLLFRLLICTVASAGFIAVLSQVHDYRGTRQAYYDFVNGDGLGWVIFFNFINEASSGIKYAITGNERHLGYFPRSDITTDSVDPNQEYREILAAAKGGSWQAQLQMSHIYALGWGRPVDTAHASEWYLQAEDRAIALGEEAQFTNSRRRGLVLAIIVKELELARMARELPPPYELAPAPANEKITSLHNS